MKAVYDFLLNREPVLTLAAVQACLGLVTAFGLDLSADQVVQINAFSAAVLGLILRRKVSPVGKSDG